MSLFQSIQLAENRIPNVGEDVGILVDGIPWTGTVTNVDLGDDDVCRVTVEGPGGDVWEPVLVLPAKLAARLRGETT